MCVHLHVDLHLLVYYLRMGRHIFSPVIPSHLVIVADGTSYRMTPPVRRHHNSPYTRNSTSPYMNSPELLDHEWKRKAQFPFSIRSHSQLSFASDASQLQQKTHTPELLDAPYKNSCAHLDDSSQLCRLFTLHPPMMISMICSVSQLRHLYNHQRSPIPCRRQPVALLRVFSPNNNHLSPHLRQRPRRLLVAALPSDYIAHSSLLLHQRRYRPLVVVATPATISPVPPCRYTSNCIARPEALAGLPPRGKRSFTPTLL